MARRLSLLFLALITCALTAGCPDHSEKRAAPDYNNMQDPGDEFAEESEE